MEYCFDNLRNILKIKPLVFNRDKECNQAMNSMEFLISCKIFIQITEALNYLHSLKPEPLIHRDLKPENILIGMFNNKRICKLADFGLSKFIDVTSGYFTTGLGTIKYTAPEVLRGDRYDTKADIWSLAICGLEIFDLKHLNLSKSNFSRFSRFIGIETIDDMLKDYERIITNELLCTQRKDRISCKQLLTQITKWKIIKTEIDFEEYKNKFKDSNLKYFFDIISEY